MTGQYRAEGVSGDGLAEDLAEDLLTDADASSDVLQPVMVQDASTQTLDPSSHAFHLGHGFCLPLPDRLAFVGRQPLNNRGRLCFSHSPQTFSVLGEPHR